MSQVKNIGKHKVLGTLGQGAHSTIFQIRREADSKEYALKVVTIEDAEEKKFLDQIEHEYRVAQMLDHPNLIKIYCLERERDWLFRTKKVNVLVEFVNGKTLDLVGAMAIPKLVHVFHQIAMGLAHMHRRGVFHADMKPNNVMLSRDSRVKILDYGLAWIKGEPKDRVQGTPEYMAPETVKTKTVNELSDIYNLGATMYRLSTFKLPPQVYDAAGGASGMLTSKAFKEIYEPASKINPNLPEDLGALIDKCLSFKPEYRPERMSEIVDTLAAIKEAVGEPEDY